ncbi:MAG TPA: hypothetical protein VFI23_06905 [Rhizomicrobium sp.]|nr:hypothetical protein [Rhizomicrobium sp.]
MAAPAALAQDIDLPQLLAVEMPKGMAQIGPTDTPLRELLASGHSGERKVTADLNHKVGVGPVRVTWSAWDGAPGSGTPAATRTARLFILPHGMTPVGVSGSENATGGNNAVHIARDASGRVHMIWQDGRRAGGHIGPVYRRASIGPDGAVHFETDPIYVAEPGPSDWNGYPALALSGRDVQLVWQGGGTAHTRRVSLGANGWTMGPIVDTGAKSEGRDVGDSIAFDAKGGLHIATPSGIYAFSGDGGKSWKTEPIPLPPNERIKTQSVTVDPAGIVHISFSAPVNRPVPSGVKQGGYWQLRAIDRTPDGNWVNAIDVLADAPAWKELHGPDDMLSDWTRIVADRQGGLHLTWHGSALSHVYAHDAAYYAWKKPGGLWSAPVLLVPPGQAQGPKFSYAPSLSLDGDRALAMVFYDVFNGPEEAFDSSLATLRLGKLAGPVLPVTRYVQAAVTAKRPEMAISSRFPAVAPAPWHMPDGRTVLDVLELLQSPFEPKGANLVVYHRIDLTPAPPKP